MAASARSPESRTLRAAPAVSYSAWARIPGCSRKKLSHWRSACGWLSAAVSPSSVAPGSASRQCSTRAHDLAGDDQSPFGEQIVGLVDRTGGGVLDRQQREVGGPGAHRLGGGAKRLVPVEQRRRPAGPRSGAGPRGGCSSPRRPGRRPASGASSSARTCASWRATDMSSTTRYSRSTSWASSPFSTASWRSRTSSRSSREASRKGQAVSSFALATCSASAMRRRSRSSSSASTCSSASRRAWRSEGPSIGAQSIESGRPRG